MKSNLDNYLFTVLSALLGIACVFLATYHYGSGITSDSVDYISTAENFIAGQGFLTFEDKIFVLQPPLFSLILTLFQKIFQIPPEQSSRYINALIFGITIFISAHLYKSILKNRYYSIFATLITVFSPLFFLSVHIWTEMLFICLVLFFLVSLNRFLSSGEMKPFLFLIFFGALACLTRYTGVTLIITGVLSILLLYQSSLKNRIFYVFIFGILTGLPLALWLARNFMLTGTLFGERAA